MTCLLQAGLWGVGIVGNCRRNGAVLLILVLLTGGIWYVTKGSTGNITQKPSTAREKDVPQISENATQRDSIRNETASSDNAAFLEEKAKASSLKFRVELLEKALAPKASAEAVEKWAEGVKTRNGALQFAMFSPGLKEQMLSSFEKLGGWVTGQSSPWVESYEISKGIPKTQDSFEFQVKFLMATSDGKGSMTNIVLVQRNKENWYISEIRTEDGHVLIP